MPSRLRLVPRMSVADCDMIKTNEEKKYIYIFFTSLLLKLLFYVAHVFSFFTHIHIHTSDIIDVRRKTMKWHTYTHTPVSLFLSLSLSFYTFFRFVNINLVLFYFYDCVKKNIFYHFSFILPRFQQD